MYIDREILEIWNGGIIILIDYWKSQWKTMLKDSDIS